MKVFYIFALVAVFSVVAFSAPLTETVRIPHEKPTQTDVYWHYLYKSAFSPQHHVFCAGYMAFPTFSNQVGTHASWQEMCRT